MVDVDPWAAMFNDGVWLMFAHMWVGAVVGFTVAGVYAAGMLRGRRDRHHRLGFMVPFVFATVFALAQPLVGHVLGLRLAEAQPAKLAEFELAETTEQPAPLTLGGYLDEHGEVKGAIRIPALGSLLAGAVALFWFLRWRRRDLLENQWFLWFAVVAGPLAIVALEAGWVATEVGRQPWVVYGRLRTTEAATDNPWLWWSLSGTALVYAGMTAAAYVVLRSMARRWREGAKDLPSPYGPAALVAAETAGESGR